MATALSVAQAVQTAAVTLLTATALPRGVGEDVLLTAGTTYVRILPTILPETGNSNVQYERMAIRVQVLHKLTNGLGATMETYLDASLTAAKTLNDFSWWRSVAGVEELENVEAEQQERTGNVIEYNVTATVQVVP